MAFAPRLCADCSFLSARCVEGDGGGWSCMVARGGNAGIDSRVGLGILDSDATDATGRFNSTRVSLSYI